MSNQVNAAKMREVVAETEKRIDKCISILTEIPDSCGYGGLLEDAADELCELKEQFIKPALSAPPEPIGNGAKTREALELFAHMNDDGYWNGSAQICNVVAKAQAALAAPPRNCDRFANETAAQIAFLNEECLINVTSLDADPFDSWTILMKYRYVKWLFAEAEGGVK